MQACVEGLQSQHSGVMWVVLLHGKHQHCCGCCTTPRGCGLQDSQVTAQLLVCQQRVMPCPDWKALPAQQPSLDSTAAGAQAATDLGCADRGIVRVRVNTESVVCCAHLLAESDQCLQHAPHHEAGREVDLATQQQQVLAVQVPAGSHCLEACHTVLRPVTPSACHNRQPVNLSHRQQRQPCWLAVGPAWLSDVAPLLSCCSRGQLLRTCCSRSPCGPCAHGGS